MRTQARRVVADVLDLGRGGTHSARFERDVRVEVTERRLAALREADAGLVFGRIDGENGERLYIGRVAIADEDNEPLVVDWRAPAAEPFYRATPGQPLGLARRRHFLLRGRRLVGIEDDLLATGSLGADGEGEELVLVGEGALLASLARARTGRMADIVATIQAEQDQIIRAPLPGILVVQGGPGTGKTAVALHRAAYLLYTYRFPLERAGVLLIGPNRVFLRYIEQVLPSLGEHTVTFATPGTLLPALSVTGEDGAAAAETKGDARMAALIARAVRQRQRGLARPAEVPFGRFVLTLTPEDSRRIVNRAKRRHGTHNGRRLVVERMVAGHLLAEARSRLTADGLDDEDAEELPENAERQLRRQRSFLAALERMWPVLTPEDLLNDLFGVPALLRLAASGVLEEREWRALERPRQRRLADVAWTEPDVALLDEAALHLGPVPSTARPAATGSAGHAVRAMQAGRGVQATQAGRGVRATQAGRGVRATQAEDDEAIFERAMEDVGDVDPTMRADLLDHLARWTREAESDDTPDLASRTFGHLLVDEAQDLSPMQARMIGRRCPAGSFTIVGDLGQASRAHAPLAWDDVTAHLPRRRPSRVTELSVNYRTPTEVMELAAAVLAAATPGLVPPRSVRSIGERPRITQVAPAELVTTTIEVARSELAALATGRVAVIGPRSLLEDLRAAMGGAAMGGAAMREGRDAGASVLEEPVAVYSLDGVKGLEFDGVVVVEPETIVAERRHGLRSLYVALTRTTHRLHLVHAHPLPAPLAPFADGVGVDGRVS